MKAYNYEQEETWRMARELAWDVYGITSRGAFEADHRVCNSVRRASFAIMANVAEGMERAGTYKFEYCLARAKEEVDELLQQLSQAQRKGFINTATLVRLESKLESLGRSIGVLMGSVNPELMAVDRMGVDYQRI